MMNWLVFCVLAAAAWLGLKWLFRQIEQHLDNGDDRYPD